MLYLTSRRHADRDEAVTPIKVYSNAAEATLLANIGRIGTQPVNGLRIAVWDGVRLKPVVNRIEVRTTLDGKGLTDVWVWTLNQTAKGGLK